MKKQIRLIFLLCASIAVTGAVSGAAFAQEKVDEMSSGEVRKIDQSTKKITIKHGEIKNLDMPGMTMVFQVKDPAMLNTVKTGDKVKFSAERSGGALVVTEIRLEK